MPKPAKNPSPEEEYRKKLISDIRPIARKEAEENPPDVNVEPEEDEEIEGEEEEEQEPQPNREDIERLTRQQRVEKTPQQQLEKGEVPEYQAEPPEAYKQPPGGPAIKPKKPGLTQRGGQAVKRGASKAGQAVKSGAEKAGQAIAQAAKKIAAQAAQFLAKAAAQAVATLAPYWGPILIGLIAVIIIIVGVVILIRALQTPNAMGSSPVQAVDILNDRPWISKVLGLSGDKNVADKLTLPVLDGLSQNLTKLESDMNNPPYSSNPAKAQILAKIQEIRGYITTFQQLPQTDKRKNEYGSKIVKAAGQLADFFGQAPWHYPGQTAWPVPKDKIHSFNSTLHCGTPMRPENCHHHRTMVQFMQGTADATDIGAPYNTPVFAAFEGTVVKRGSVLGTYLEIKSLDGHYLAVYMHMQAVKFNQGDHVQVGNQIGQLTGIQSGITHPHLHFELYKDGQAVVTTREDIASRKYGQVGQYLWERDKAALNLN